MPAFYLTIFNVNLLLTYIIISVIYLMKLLVANITAGGPVSLCVFLCQWFFFHSQLETQENKDLFRRTEKLWKTLIAIAHACVCVYVCVHMCVYIYVYIHLYVYIHIYYRLLFFPGLDGLQTAINFSPPLSIHEAPVFLPNVSSTLFPPPPHLYWIF
jgi:hypothetical protein